MNFKYDFVDINLLFAADETTEEIQREKREVMAEYQLYDPQTLPLVLIDSKWYTYPEAMAFLKKNHSQ